MQRIESFRRFILLPPEGSLLIVIGLLNDPMPHWIFFIEPFIFESGIHVSVCFSKLCLPHHKVVLVRKGILSPVQVLTRPGPA